MFDGHRLPADPAARVLSDRGGGNAGSPEALSSGLRRCLRLEHCNDMFCHIVTARYTLWSAMQPNLLCCIAAFRCLSTPMNLRVLRMGI
jgi:hypothetical protein